MVKFKVKNEAVWQEEEKLTQRKFSKNLFNLWKNFLIDDNTQVLQFLYKGY